MAVESVECQDVALETERDELGYGEGGLVLEDVQLRHGINISQPEKHGDNSLSNAYISYEVTSTSSESGKAYRVRRRYQDFLWLTEKLAEAAPNSILPPLPDKHRLDFLGRFTPEFIRRRQAGLLRFLRRIDRHPVLSRSAEFASFLQSPIAGYVAPDTAASLPAADLNASDVSLKPAGALSYFSPLLESLGDVMQATFARSPKAPDPQYEAIRRRLQLLRKYLAALERLLNSRILSQQPAAATGLRSIADGFEKLSAAVDVSLQSDLRPHNEQALSLPFIKAMLSRVAATLAQCGQVLEKSASEQELEIVAVLAEYVLYCDAALEKVHERDKRQLELEELHEALSKCQAERDQIRGILPTAPGANVSGEGSGGGASPCAEPSQVAASQSVGPGWVAFLSQKIEQLKGIDPVTARQGRLATVESRIQALEEALILAKKLALHANEHILAEVAAFESILQVELHDALRALSAYQGRLHEQNLVYWKDFLAWIGNPPRHLSQ